MELCRRAGSLWQMQVNAGFGRSNRDEKEGQLKIVGWEFLELVWEQVKTPPSCQQGGFPS
jgi:hypothetical protein